MAAARKNITIEQGSRFLLRLKLVSKTTGQMLDLSSGYTARMKVRTVADDAVVVSLTDEDGITLSDDTGTYNIEIKIGADVTAQMDFRDARWDFELIPSSGEVDAERLIGGDALLSKEATK